MLKNEAVPVKTKRPLLNGAWSKRKNIYIHLYNINTCCTPKYKVNELINKGNSRLLLRAVVRILTEARRRSTREHLIAIL